MFKRNTAARSTATRLRRNMSNSKDKREVKSNSLQISISVIAMLISLATLVATTIINRETFFPTWKVNAVMTSPPVTLGRSSSAEFVFSNEGSQPVRCSWVLNFKQKGQTENQRTMVILTI